MEFLKPFLDFTLPSPGSGVWRQLVPGDSLAFTPVRLSKALVGVLGDFFEVLAWGDPAALLDECGVSGLALLESGDAADTALVFGEWSLDWLLLLDRVLGEHGTPPDSFCVKGSSVVLLLSDGVSVEEHFAVWPGVCCRDDFLVTGLLELGGVLVCFMEALLGECWDWPLATIFQQIQ